MFHRFTEIITLDSIHSVRYGRRKLNEPNKLNELNELNKLNEPKKLNKLNEPNEPKLRRSGWERSEFPDVFCGIGMSGNAFGAT